MSNTSRAADSPSLKATHHFGRGGAGNTTLKDHKSPSLPPSSTPTLKHEHYTTGRGGTGNMAKNDPSKPEEARAAQDVDVPGILLSEGPRSTGRGGAANVYHPSDEEIAQARANNESLRRDSAAKRGSGLKAVVEKGKEMLKGRKDKDVNGNADESAVAE